MDTKADLSEASIRFSHPTLLHALSEFLVSFLYMRNLDTRWRNLTRRPRPKYLGDNIEGD